MPARFIGTCQERAMKTLETTYKILSSDCDRHGFWKPARILVMMQELAGEHSGILGFSFADMLKLGAVWVVTRNEFEVLRYPEIAQTVYGKTFPGRPRRGIYPRYYQVEDEAGQPLVRGSSFWVLADVNTRQMVDLAAVSAAMPDTSGLLPYYHNPGAAEELGAGSPQRGRWQPVYTDLDRNGHVNNTRAGDQALCFLSRAADLSRHPVRTLLASYHRELTEQDQVDMAFVSEGPAFSLRFSVRGTLALRMSGRLFEQAVKPGGPAASS